MKIKVECWKCGHKFEAEPPKQHLGVKCPRCGAIIQYPPLPL